jgi:hypothetical protein
VASAPDSAFVTSDFTPLRFGAGVCDGDQIVAVNGVSLAGSALDDLLTLVKKVPIGGTIVLTMRRPVEAQPSPGPLRRRVPKDSVDLSHTVPRLNKTDATVAGGGGGGAGSRKDTFGSRGDSGSGAAAAAGGKAAGHATRDVRNSVFAITQLLGDHDRSVSTSTGIGVKGWGAALAFGPSQWAKCDGKGVLVDRLQDGGAGRIDVAGCVAVFSWRKDSFASKVRVTVAYVLHTHTHTHTHTHKHTHTHTRAQT